MASHQKSKDMRNSFEGWLSSNSMLCFRNGRRDWTAATARLLLLLTYLGTYLYQNNGDTRLMELDCTNLKTISAWQLVWC